MATNICLIVLRRFFSDFAWYYKSVACAFFCFDGFYCLSIAGAHRVVTCANSHLCAGRKLVAVVDLVVVYIAMHGFNLNPL
jgi:hypothetical protein